MTVRGIVAEALPNARFRCTAEDGVEVTCHVSGNARLDIVRILPGDTVAIERSQIDPSKGRITGKVPGRPEIRRQGS